MHVVVLGAGVVGITGAHYLIEAGHSVTVIDAADAVAAGCSYANGSQLSYSYTDAMATPSFLRKLPGILTGRDIGVQFRAALSADLIRWGAAFIGQCSNRKAIANTLATLQMAQRSKTLIAELRASLDADFSYRSAGKLVLLSDDDAVENAKRNCDLKVQNGCVIKVVDMQEASSIEPAIAHMTGHYSGAVYSPGDDAGDAHAFSKALATRMQASGQFGLHLNTEVLNLIGGRDRIRGVATNRGEFEADAVVVSMGARSPALLRPLGLRPMILPARGYSVTLPNGTQPVSVSITDPANRFVIGRNNGKTRIAGFADFVGFRSNRDQQRIRQLVEVAQQRAPHVADYSQTSYNDWGGFRPLTPDGRPLIGATPVPGLYLNTGHGSLGWTLACASGEALAKSLTPAVQRQTGLQGAADPSTGLRSSYTR